MQQAGLVPNLGYSPVKQIVMMHKGNKEIISHGLGANSSRFVLFVQWQNMISFIDPVNTHQTP